MIKITSPKTAGLLGILGPILTFLSIVTSIFLHPWFDLADNALSDLGALGTSHNLIFNLGLIFAGVAGLIFTLGLTKIVKGKIGFAGAAVFGAGMLFVILIGVFPSGTSPHRMVSMGFYALCTLGMITIGVDQFRDRSERIWGAFTLSVVGLSLAAVMLTTTIPYKLGAAIPEIIGAIAISEFSIVFGAKLLDFL